MVNIKFVVALSYASFPITLAKSVPVQLHSCKCALNRSLISYKFEYLITQLIYHWLMNECMSRLMKLRIIICLLLKKIYLHLLSLIIQAFSAVFYNYIYKDCNHVSIACMVSTTFDLKRQYYIAIS